MGFDLDNNRTAGHTIVVGHNIVVRRIVAGHTMFAVDSFVLVQVLG
jgi:hypothetical protein